MRSQERAAARVSRSAAHGRSSGMERLLARLERRLGRFAIPNL